MSWSRRHRLAVVLGTLCLSLASLAGMRRLAFDTDVLSLLPREGTAIPAFRTFVDRFGTLDQLYVVFTAPNGYAAADYERTIRVWTDRLRRLDGISRVDSGMVDRSADLAWLGDRLLLLLPDEKLARALSRFRPAGMREAIAARRELLTMPSPAVVDLVRNDPLGLLELLAGQLGGSRAGIDVGLTGTGYATPDGRSRMLVLTPAQPPYDTEFSRALMARLEDLRLQLSQAPGPDAADDPLPPLSVRVAGGHRIAVETEALVRRESIMNTVGALALVLPLLWLVFRSLWLVAVGPLPSAASLVIVLGLLGLAGSTLSAAGTASAAMLFGLGVDGVVLLYVAYAHAMAEGADITGGIQRLGGPASSMLLGMWTTAATFYGLAWVDFPSLEQLGLLIGHSMVLCGVFTLVLVPALLPARPLPRQRRPLTMPRLAAWVERHRRVILVAGVAVTLVLGAASTRLRVNPTLERLRAVTPGARLLDELGPAFGLPGEAHVVVARGMELDPLLEANERLADHIRREIPDALVQAPSMLLPSSATQAHRAAVVRSAGLSPLGVKAALADAASAESFRRDSFAPFEQRLPALLDAEQRLTFEGFIENGLGDLIDRLVVRNGQEWLLATHVFLQDESRLAALERIAAANDGAGTVTGLPLVNRELAAQFLPQFIKGLAVGSAVVLALVVVAFRDWWLSVLSLVPTLIGLVWAAGLLALAGVELDLFAVFAVVTFVGIGVDYGIHLVHRYRERGDARRAVEELAPVILVAAGITLVGYGTLVGSRYPPLRSIGLVAVVSVATLSVASVLVLPAMLASRGGRRV